MREKESKDPTNLKFIETEPWTPPADAHPEIGLFEFCKDAWRILEPAEPFVDNWHIHTFIEHAEAISLGQLPERNLLVNTPPGTTKSLFWAVLWPAWEWTWAPWTRWLTLSYDESLALRDAVKCRRLMQTLWYRHVTSLEWRFVGDQNVKGNYVNDKTGWRIATSIKGAVTGNHALHVLVDDPHSVRKAESDAEREATLAIWRETIPSRVLPSGSRIMIGQRTHEEDCTADWLNREGSEIHHIELKMEYEKPPATRSAGGLDDHSTPAQQQGFSHAVLRSQVASGMCSLTHQPHDPRKREGELLVPQRYPQAVLERRKIELGPYAWGSQYQQTPTPRAGMVLNPAWFPQTPELERATVDLVAAFDLNYSDVETSDWTVGMLGAVERTAVMPKLHIVDAFRDHLSEERHVEKIGEWLMLWKPLMVGIEKRAYEKQGAARDLCRQLMEYCEARGWSLDIEPIEVDTDKVSRAMIIPGRAKAGLITVDKRSTWWPILSRQMSQFPRSSHDDDIDALAHLTRLVVEKFARLRSVGNLLGKSAEIAYSEDDTGHRRDWASAALAGIR